MIRFSVIIPAYNCAGTIRKTVQSVLSSRLNNVEIIIVDDGSTDDTASVCKEMCRACSVIQYFYKENTGVSDTRNIGIMKARGEYILFVDSDDILLPFDIPELENNLKEDPDIICYGMIFQSYRKKRVIKEESICTEFNAAYKLNDLPECFSYLFAKNYLSSACNKLIKRSTVTKNLIQFNCKLNNYEDLEFSLRVMCVSKSIVALQSPYYVYQTEYGTDRTPLRIAKIKDIMNNTDIIAEAFFRLDAEVIRCAGKGISGIYPIVLQIYMEIFRHKMYSTKIRRIVPYCDAFAQNSNIQKCVNACPELKQKQEYRRIMRRNPLELYLYYLYLRLRHRIANRIKLFLHLMRG